MVKVGYSLLLTEFDKTIINKIMTSSTAPLNIFKTFTHICMNKVKILKYYIRNNAMCYTMLCMLEWMRKMKHRIGTLRTQGLRGSALMAYIHGGIP